MTVPILLFNGGNEADFTLSISQITTGNGSLNLGVESDVYIKVGANATEEILVNISVSVNATDGQTSTFTLLAESTLDDSNDFIVFKVDVTTLPPPKFTENVSVVLIHDVYESTVCS